METTIENISPTLAAKYLEANTCNRAIKKTIVATYAKDMASGNWKLSHQGIAFNCDGTLLDGQHRLMAIIESGCTIKIIVTRGVPSESQLVMDDHAKRTAGDALTLYRNEKISDKSVAYIRAAIELQDNQRYLRATKYELNELIDIFKSGLDFINTQIGGAQKGITAAPVWGAILLAYYYVPDENRLGDFCDIILGKRMATAETDNAAHALREWLIKNGMRGASLRIESFKKTQKAIHCFMKYEKITRLISATDFIYKYPFENQLRK